MDKKIGVYCILNTKENKRYIGKSINIYKRFLNHKTLLNNNKHPNKKLQNGWNEHGEESFNFSIIEECTHKSLTKREQHYIKFYNCIKEGYNKNDAIKQNQLKAVSHYLQQRTVKQLSVLAKQSNMGISAFLQYLLDETLDNVIIDD